MKRTLLLILLLSVTTVFSQKKSKFWEKVHFGGSVGLGFSSNNTTISASPSAIYEFNPQFSTGLGIGYLYNKQNEYKSNVISTSLLAFYNPITLVQLSAEFEQLFVNQKYQNFKNSYNYPALYLGASYVTGRVSVGFRYDVLYNKNKSIYSSALSPVIRIYF